VLGIEGGGDAAKAGDVSAVGEDVVWASLSSLEGVEDEAGLGFGAVEGVEGGGVGVVESGAAVWVDLQFGGGRVLELGGEVFLDEETVEARVGCLGEGVEGFGSDAGFVAVVLDPVFECWAEGAQVADVAVELLGGHAVDVGHDAAVGFVG